MGENVQENAQKKRKFAVPHVYILLLVIIAIFAILSYIMPASVYDTKTIDGREIIQASTWHTVAKTPVSLMQFLTAGSERNAGIRADYLLHLHRRRCIHCCSGDESD